MYMQQFFLKQQNKNTPYRKINFQAHMNKIEVHQIFRPLFSISSFVPNTLIMYLGTNSCHVLKTYYLYTSPFSLHEKSNIVSFFSIHLHHMPGLYQSKNIHILICIIKTKVHILIIIVSCMDGSWSINIQPGPFETKFWIRLWFHGYIEKQSSGNSP